MSSVSRLSLVVCLAALTACAPPPPVPEQPTTSGHYEFTVTMTPTPLPDGTSGTSVGIAVRPPHPEDPTEQAIARQLEDEFLRRMQAHDLPR